MSWSLYVLECRGGTLYTGITNDLPHRIAEHRAGRGAKYTRARLPVRLVAAWRFPDRRAAARAESRFKALPRAAKLAWIEGRWPFEEAPFDFEALGETSTAHFCPRCGGRLVPREVEPGRFVPVCTVCGRYHFRNAKPCAGILLVRGAQVLLARRLRDPHQGELDIPGGFMDAEESPDACAIREAKEETGLDVRLVDLLGFYMDTYEFQGEVSNILNIYYVAEAEGEPQPGDDASALEWHPIAEPPTMAFRHEAVVLRDLQRWVPQGGLSREGGWSWPR